MINLCAKELKLYLRVCVGVEKKLCYNNDILRTRASLSCATLSWFYLPAFTLEYDALSSNRIHKIFSVNNRKYHVYSHPWCDKTKSKHQYDCSFLLFNSLCYFIRSLNVVFISTLHMMMQLDKRKHTLFSLYFYSSGVLHAFVFFFISFQHPFQRLPSLSLK